jgi:futalosine hydrolase
MKVLLVSATKEEILVSNLPHLVTGVGMVSTAIAVTNALSKSNYDLVINAGIAGSFNRSLKIGQVVEVTKDYFSELGAQDGVHFLTPDEINLNVVADIEMNPATNLDKVSGITVNTIHGEKIAIQKVVHRFNPQIESMEGAACMLACQKAGVPCVQIRSISNYVEKRNKSNWNIPLAIQNLNKELIKIIADL